MSQTQSVSLQGVTMLPPFGKFRPAVLTTTGGIVETRWYEAPGATSALILLGDRAGGFDSPANGLYEKLALHYQEQGAGALLVQYRKAHDPVQVGLDGLIAAYLMQRLEISRVVLVAWGIGAVGAIQAVHQFKTVAGVALIAPRAVARTDVDFDRPLLLLHGTGDREAPTQTSRDLLAKAAGPKQIKYFPDAGHDLSEVAEAAEAELRTWIDRHLGLVDPS
jgi:fermentation-respiration switch protein FrsA (DUF1100 family)